MPHAKEGISTMKVGEQTISELGSVITGDANLSPYRSGPDLVAFFNQFCDVQDQYGKGFPSRWAYAEEKLRELNDSRQFTDVLLAAIDPRHFLGTDWDCETVVERLNLFLEYDGYVVRRQGLRWEVAAVAGDTVGDIVEVLNPFDGSADLTHEFIAQQLDKSKERLERGDYDGAITNARSLLEAVLSALERKYDPEPPDYDGNLLKLYRRVQQHLNLTPGQKDLADCLRQILSGLASVVHGLATLRNRMSDSHVVTYRAENHHARLAVNCARTMAQFLFDTSEYQQERDG